MLVLLQLLLVNLVTRVTGKMGVGDEMGELEAGVEVGSEELQKMTEEEEDKIQKMEDKIQVQRTIDSKGELPGSTGLPGLPGSTGDILGEEEERVFVSNIEPWLQYR